MKTPRDSRDRGDVSRCGPGASGGAKRRASSGLAPSWSVSRLTSRLPARDRGPAGLDLVSARDQDLRVVRQEKVHPRAEPDHPDSLPAPESLADPGIEHDAAGGGRPRLL